MSIFQGVEVRCEVDEQTGRLSILLKLGVSTAYLQPEAAEQLAFALQQCAALTNGWGHVHDAIDQAPDLTIDRAELRKLFRTHAEHLLVPGFSAESQAESLNL